MIGQRNEGIFAVLEGIIAGVGEKLGGAMNAIGEAMGHGGGESAGGSLGGGLGESLKGMLGFTSGGERSPELAQARAPEMEMTVARAPDPHHFDPSDLGNLAPPSLGSAMKAQGAGMGMMG